MNCRKCGNILNENENFCRICGEPVNNQNISDVNQNNQMPTVQPVEPQISQSPAQVNFAEPTIEQSAQVAQTAQVEQSTVAPQYTEPQVAQPNMQQVGQVQQQNMPGMQQYPEQIAQPQQFTQPMMQNSGQMPGAIPVQMPNPKPNNNNKGFIIILIIMVIAIIGLGSFVGRKILSGNITKQVEEKYKKQENNNNNEDNQDNKESDNNNDSDNKEPDNNEENIIADNTNIYESGGYKFLVPTNLKYQIDAGLLSFSDSLTYQANMTVTFLPYSEIKANPSIVLTELENQGSTIISSAEKMIADKNFYLVDILNSNQEGIFYFTEIDEFYIAIGFIIAKDVNSYNNALEAISQMVKSASKSSMFSPNEGENKTTDISLDTKIFENTDIQGTQYKLD